MKLLSNPQVSIFLKSGFILFLILMLMIPNAFLHNMIYERQQLKENVIREVAQGWGESQTITGPILSIPFTKEINLEDGERKEVSSFLHVTPQNVSIDGDLVVTQKKRSIYEILLYKSEVKITGEISIPELSEKVVDLKETYVEKSILSLGIQDLKGIQESVNVVIEGQSIPMKTGKTISFLSPSSIESTIDIKTDQKTIRFSIDLKLKGCENFSVIPMADYTQVDVEADWGSPSFQGGILPDTSSISANHFSATWTATEYHRSVPPVWQGNINLGYRNNSLGVNLIQGVDQYQKNLRSAKYALLIIGLTFALFFFFEYAKDNQVHPIQYTLIGLALSLFYYLLLSISEHAGFDLAYLVSAGSVITLISFYTFSLLNSNLKSTLLLSAILSGLYIYIYILLKMEDYAFITGSIGLFVILSIIMYATRKINWYKLGSREADFPEE